MQMGSAFMGFFDTDCHATEGNEPNFAVFCQNFTQKILTNQNLLKFPGISNQELRLPQFPGIPDREFLMALLRAEAVYL